MDTLTATQVSQYYGVSTRMLRYYEQMGLLKSSRMADYTYRVYDEAAIRRLQQVIILRKLQIPVKQIRDMLNNQDAVTAIEIFKQNISELDEEITALSVVKSILARFVEELQDKADIPLKLDLLNDTTMLTVVSTLSFSENKLKEKTSMEDLNKANNVLAKQKRPRIIQLPPMTVASIHCIAEEDYNFPSEMPPENESESAIRKFVKERDLPETMPGFRYIWFNNPDVDVVDDGKKGHGFERWVTIPDDWEVAAPFVKKHFVGGMYAAHTIHISEMDEWLWLHSWIGESKRYDFRWGTLDDGACKICGWLTESLNALEYFQWTEEECEQLLQVDLLIPIQLI